MCAWIYFSTEYIFHECSHNLDRFGVLLMRRCWGFLSFSLFMVEVSLHWLLFHSPAPRQSTLLLGPECLCVLYPAAPSCKDVTDNSLISASFVLNDWSVCSGKGGTCGSWNTSLLGCVYILKHGMQVTRAGGKLTSVLPRRLQGFG